MHCWQIPIASSMAKSPGSNLDKIILLSRYMHSLSALRKAPALDPDKSGLAPLTARCSTSGIQ